MAENNGNVKLGILTAGIAFLVWCLGKVSNLLEAMSIAEKFVPLRLAIMLIFIR